MSDEKKDSLGYPTLNNFNDWVNWAAVAKKLKLKVKFSDGTIIEATDSSKNDIIEEFWNDLFPVSSFVREYKFPVYLTTQPIISYPVNDVFKEIKDIYSKVGGKSLNKKPIFSSPDPKENNIEYQEKLIPLKKLTTDIGNKSLNEGFSNGMLKQMNTKGIQSANGTKQFRSFNSSKITDFGFENNTEKNFFLLSRYYTRDKSIRDIKRGDNIINKTVPKRITTPKIDFHEALSSMSDFPKLMRMLGVVIDFEIPVSSLPSSATWIQFESPWGIHTPVAYNKDTFCKTAIALNGGKFQAANNPELGAKSEVENGMVKLNDESLFKLVGLDVDGAGLKIIQLARTLLPYSNLPESKPMYASTDDLMIEQANISNLIQTPPAKFYLQDLGEEKEQPLPALRSNGITLTKQERAKYVEAMIDRMAFANKTAIENNQAPLFYAEDLLRGYRVDVKDINEGAWRSLCERVGKYKLGNKNFEIIDEGYLKSASMSRENPDNDSSKSNRSELDAYLHEAVFTWFGWSLVADKPGKTIVQNTYDSSGKALETPREEVKHRDESKPETEFGLITNFKTKPSSLPKLRFGNSYKFRLRTVDLAGNSLPLETQSDTNASAPLTYRRFEPIPSPVLMPRKTFSEGESLEAMVIRSNYEKNSFEYNDQNYVKDITIKKYYNGYFHENDRHVVPPKSAQNMAEHHKVFDSALGINKNYEQWYKIALKEEGQLSDTKIVDINSGEKTIDVSGDIEIITTPNTPLPHAKLPLAPGEPLGQGQYIVNKSEKLVLPYLPEHIAKGASFRRLPFAGGGGGYIEFVTVPESGGELITKVPFDVSFPDASPFKIRIIEGNGVPSWDVSTRTLIVKLPKAMVANVDFSCFINSSDADYMGIIDWLPNDKKSMAKTLATIGGTWMITPWRTLTMVHAVQQPLIAPKFTNLKTRKELIGQTYALLDGKYDVNVESTGQIDILAKWKDPNDDPANKKYTGGESEEDFINNKGHIGDLLLMNKKYNPNSVSISDELDLIKNIPSKNEDSVKNTNEDKIIRGDGRDEGGKEKSKRTNSDDNFEANKRTSDNVKFNFLKAIPLDTSLVKLDLSENNFAKETYFKWQKKYLLPLNFDNMLFKHEFGDTKYHKVSYMIKGTTRFREYFPQEIWGNEINDPKNDDVLNGEDLKKRIHRIGEKIEVKVLNSARPDSPKILYVVPTFGWDKPSEGAPTNSGNGVPIDIVSRRCGGGLRVYLERPWFSSGDEELLGVILAEGFTASSGLKAIKNTGGKNIPDKLKPYVTQWGNDPIWSSELLKGVTPDSTDFPLSVKTLSGLTIPDLEGVTVTAVGHKPEYDKVRGLWYCDIDVDMGNTYYPFIRMALARFQPNSIDDTHLSPVILSDFAQLTPSRVAAITFTDKDRFRIMVSGTYGTNSFTVKANIGDIYNYQTKNKEGKEVGIGLQYSRVIMATIEKKTGVNTWIPVSEEFTNLIVPPFKEVDDTMIWLAKIDMTDNKVRTANGQDIISKKIDFDRNAPLRVSIREFEFYESDIADTISKTVHGFNNPIKLRSRIVYADIIQIK